MSKTYTLISTNIIPGISSTYSNDWTCGTAIQGALRVGKYDDKYSYAIYEFDHSILDTLRSKTIISITLKVKTEQYPVNQLGIRLSYKYGGGQQRGNAAGTSTSTSQIGQFTSIGTTSGQYTTFNLTGTELAGYGYMLGPSDSSINYYFILDSGDYANNSYTTAILTVVTDENDNTIRIVNNSVLDTYLVYIVNNNTLEPYEVKVVNNGVLDSYN